MATNTDAAVEATARQYYGAQDLLRPGTPSYRPMAVHPGTLAA